MKIRGLTPCEHRRRFVLIDLRTQIYAVQRHTTGWHMTEVIDWLWLYGSVFNGFHQHVSFIDSKHVTINQNYAFVGHHFIWFGYAFYFDSNSNLTPYAQIGWR